MRMVPMYPQYSQPLPQPAMIYRNQPIYYSRFRRYDDVCCDSLCCDRCCMRCCDECCG